MRLPESKQSLESTAPYQICGFYAWLTINVGASSEDEKLSPPQARILVPA
jgi:hypothetical protein